MRHDGSRRGVGHHRQQMGEAYIRQYKAAAKWTIRCAGCARLGVRPDTPNEIMGTGRALRMTLEVLDVDERGLCQHCRGAGAVTPEWVAREFACKEDRTCQACARVYGVHEMAELMNGGLLVVQSFTKHVFCRACWEARDES